jgi:hypothetical protein
MTANPRYKYVIVVVQWEPNAPAALSTTTGRRILSSGGEVARASGTAKSDVTTTIAASRLLISSMTRSDWWPSHVMLDYSPTSINQCRTASLNPGRTDVSRGAAASR